MDKPNRQQIGNSRGGSIRLWSIMFGAWTNRSSLRITNVGLHEHRVDARVDRSVSSERLSPPGLYHVVLSSLHGPRWQPMTTTTLTRAIVFHEIRKKIMRSCRNDEGPGRVSLFLTAFQRFGSQVMSASSPEPQLSAANKLYYKPKMDDLV